MDGGFQRQPPHLRDQAGSGWLVLASDEAMQTLAEYVGGLYKAIQIRRSITRDKQKDTKRWFTAESLLGHLGKE
jgi:hypothetical protein